jgi:hypothetical protein
MKSPIGFPNKDVMHPERGRNTHNPKDVKARLAAKLAASRTAKTVKTIPVEAPKKKKEVEEEGPRREVHVSPEGKKTTIVHTGNLGLPDTATDDERACALMAFIDKTVTEEKVARADEEAEEEKDNNSALEDSVSRRNNRIAAFLKTPQSLMKEATLDAFVASVASFEQEMTNEASWLRGLCATMEKCVYTLAEAMLSVCLALGKNLRGLDMEKECVYTETETVKMHLLRGLMEVGSPDMFPFVDGQRKALDHLLVLTAADYISMGPPAVWIVCEILLKVFPLLKVPCRVAPLALHWLNHTAVHRHQERRKHIEAVVWFAKFLHDRGQPIPAGAIADHGLAVNETLPASDLMLARLHFYRGACHLAMKEMERGLERFRRGLALDTENRRLPASLMIDLYDGAIIACDRMDRCDLQFQYMTQTAILLRRETPAYDGEEEERLRISHVLAIDMAYLLGKMRCFCDALSTVMLVPSSFHDKLGAKNFDTVTAMIAKFSEAAMMNHDDVIFHDCQWRKCHACYKISKDMLHCPCTTVFYCNEQCQLKDWPAHERNCARCWTCGQVGFTFRHCSRCMRVRYCTQECLNADWPRHKSLCIPLVVKEPEDVSPAEIVEDDGPVFSEPIPLGDCESDDDDDEEVIIVDAMHAVSTPDGWFETLVRVLGNDE